MDGVIATNAQWINEIWEKIDRKLQKVCIRSRDKLPYTSVNGVHTNKTDPPAYWWCNGFWGGIMWLMYLGTDNAEYKLTAERSEQLLDKTLEDFKRLHHDVGFIWKLSGVANYRITGNAASATKSLYAASTLASRFNVDGNYIRAWNGSVVSDANKGWTIIDTMMNLPLLYWASREIGDDRFAKVAMRHADMVLRDHIRPDGSVNHIVEHNENTGELVAVQRGQGYSETSSWSRGVAWAVYGMTLSHIHTGQQRYLDAAILAADHFIAECKKTNYLPAVDFYAPKEPVYYDSTAGMCAACGLLELAKCLGGDRGKYYAEEAIKLLKAADAHFCNYSDDEDALVLMGSERYPHDERGFKGLHMPIIYGDFFFVEAMFKLKGNDFLIW
jgi:unsaturated chondroitin disaccharide hydrolase